MASMDFIKEWKLGKKKNKRQLTPAYVHWRLTCIPAGFAPAFTLSLCDSEAPANRQCP
jgi:hypothetical protein